MISFYLPTLTSPISQILTISDLPCSEYLCFLDPISHLSNSVKNPLTSSIFHFQPLTIPSNPDHPTLPLTMTSPYSLALTIPH